MTVKMNMVMPEKFAEWFSRQENPGPEAVARMQEMLRAALGDIAAIPLGDKKRAEKVGLALARRLKIAKARGKPKNGLKRTAREQLLVELQNTEAYINGERGQSRNEQRHIKKHGEAVARASKVQASYCRYEAKLGELERLVPKKLKARVPFQCGGLTLYLGNSKAPGRDTKGDDLLSRWWSNNTFLTRTGKECGGDAIQLGEIPAVGAEQFLDAILKIHAT